MLFFLVVCVFQFFFFKNFGFAVGGQRQSQRPDPPRGRARTRGRPTAAERISVFKAFENKLLQFPGYRVGVGRGVPGHSFPRV